MEKVRCLKYILLIHGRKSNREFVQKVDLWKGSGVYITWMCPRAGHCADAGNHTAVGLDQQTGSADKTEQSCLLAIFLKQQIRKGLDGNYFVELDQQTGIADKTEQNCTPPC